MTHARRANRSLVLGAALAMIVSLLFVATPLGAGSADAAEIGLPAFSKAFAPSTIGPGSTSRLTFTIDNSDNPGAGAQDLAFTDTLPAGQVIADPGRAQTNCPGGKISAPAGGTTITFTGGSVAPGATCRVAVDVVGTTTGTNVSGDLTSSRGNSGTASATLTVDSDLPGITKSFSPSSITPGQRSTLTITIDNSQNDGSATFLGFSDPLPAGVVFASPTNLQTVGCGSTPSVTFGETGRTLSVSVASVPSGETCAISLDVIGQTQGAKDNKTTNLEVGSPSTIAGFATDRLEVVRGHLDKLFSPNPFQPAAGATLQLAFTLRNPSRTSPATAVAFTDDLGAMLTGAEFSSVVSNTCGGRVRGTSVMRFSGGTIPADGSCSLVVEVSIPSDAAPGAYPNTTSAFTASIDGSTVRSDVATDVLVISSLAIVKEFTNDPVGAGGVVTLEFTITNQDPDSSVSDITFQDELTTFLPEPIVWSGPTPNPPCGDGSSLTLFDEGLRAGLELLGGFLAANSSCTFSVELTIPNGQAPGAFTNTTGEITGLRNNEEMVAASGASDDLVVVGAPRFLKEFGADVIEPGDPVQLTFTITNENLDTALTNIGFSDDFRTFLSGVALSSVASNSCGGTVTTSAVKKKITFSGGSLAADSECAIVLNLNTPAGATPDVYTNTTTAITAMAGTNSLTGLAASDDLEIAGLALEKAFIDDPVAPGGQVTLEFTITNLTTSLNATGIIFHDDIDTVVVSPSNQRLRIVGALPATPCGASSLLTESDGIITLSGGEVPADSSCTFELLLEVPADTLPRNYPNVTYGFQASLGGTTVHPSEGRDELIVDLPLAPQLAKEFTNDPVAPGGTVNLRFTLLNLEESLSASNISFSDNLEATLPGLRAVGLPVAGCGGTATTFDGGATIDFSGGSLIAGGSCFFDVTLSVPNPAAGGAHTNMTSDLSADVGGSAVSAAGARDDLVIETPSERAADLSITKTATPDTALAGADTITYTVVVSNAGPDAATGVVVTDTPGSGLSFGSSSGCAEDPRGILSCSLGTIPSGGSAQYTYTASVDSSTTADVSNTVTVTSTTPDPNSANNTATETVTVETEADLSVTKTDDIDPVSVNGTIIYTVTVSNAGPSDALNVVATDTLPAGVTLVATSGCAEDPSGVPTCSLGTIAAGGSAQYTIEVTAPDGVGDIDNTVSVTSDTADPDSSNNSTTETTTVDAEADLSVTKTGTVLGSDLVEYVITTTNNGPDTAYDATLTDTLPAGTSFRSISGCAKGAGPPTFELGDLPSGSSVVCTIVVKVTADGLDTTLVNTATVASDSTDPDTSDNTATHSQPYAFCRGQLATILGTPGSDVIVGTNGADVIVTLGGDDNVRGGLGDDTICTNDGDDTVQGGPGNDSIFGGPGNDALRGGRGNDIIEGGSGNDSLSGGRGDDNLQGNSGSDRISGRNGADRIDGGADDDMLFGNSGSDTIDGSGGKDIVFGGADNDILRGGDGKDRVRGGTGNDTISGQAGSDILVGGDDNDTMSGGTGNDRMRGEAGDDTMDGGANADVMTGGDGNDTMNGKAGNDILLGEDGNDTLDGGPGIDYLAGGNGVDTCINGELGLVGC